MNKDVKDVGKSVTANVTSHVIKRGLRGCFGCVVPVLLLIMVAAAASVAMCLR